MKNIKYKAGFTLVELLVVIAIIGILSTVAVVNLNHARAKARDAKRISDINQITIALKVYYENHGQYPSNTDSDCAGWDADGDESFMQDLVDDGMFGSVPSDPLTSGDCIGFRYKYHRYNAGQYGCDVSRGPYFVLVFANMETVNHTTSHSPGWSCPDRDWTPSYAWVMGGFEN